MGFKFISDMKLNNPSALSTGGGVWQDETLALIARITSAPSWPQQMAMNRLILDLKTAGIWAKADVIIAALPGNEQGHQRNWKGDVYNASPVSAPVWDGVKGCYAGNGAGYLTMGLNLSTAVGLNAKQNDISVSYWPLADGANGNYLGGQDGIRMGGVTGTANSGAVFGQFGGFRLNSAASSFPSERALQPFDLLTLNRSAADKYTVMAGAAPYGTFPVASAAFSNMNFTLIGNLGIGNFASTGKLAFFMLGAALTEAQQITLRYAVRRYLISIGAVQDTAATLTTGSQAFAYGGALWQTQNANRSWSFLRDGAKMRFDVREGDQWAADVTFGNPKDRSEIYSTSRWGYSADVWLAWSMVLPPECDPTPAFKAFIAGQLHADDTLTSAPPPWSVGFADDDGTPEYLRLRRLWDTVANNPPILSAEMVYSEAPNAPVRGRVYNWVFRLRFKQDGTGVYQAWLNGVQVVNKLNTNLGFAADVSAGAYPKFGIYRGQTNVRSVAEYYNLRIGTDDLSAYIANPLPILD